MQSKELTIWLIQALLGIGIMTVGFVVKRLWSELDDTHDDVALNSQRINAVEVLIATLKANDTASSERMAGLKQDIKELRTEFITRVEKLDEKLDKIVERQNSL